MRTSFYFVASLSLGALAVAQDGDVTTSGGAIQSLAASVGSGPTVIYSNLTGMPHALVPGMGGLEFNAGVSSSSAFDRPFRSPNGSIIQTALMETTATGDDEIILLNGAVVAREGDAVPFSAGDLWGTIDTRVDVNDSGQFVFSNNLTPGTVNDDYIVRGEGAGVFTAIAQEGGAIPMLAGSTWDDTLDSALILANGDVGFSADLVDGGTITSTTDDLLILGPTLLAQEGVTIPGNQAGGATDFDENFDLEDYYATDDGLHYLYKGDLTTATTADQVVVYDGNVVLQENSIIAGSSFVDPIDASGIVEISMDEAGNWYARGNNDVTEDDWVVRNGAVIATVGQSIDGVSAEIFDDTAYTDCFFLHVGNQVGDYVVGGVTDAVNLDANAVLVLNGTQVICREFDPVDVDGNGLFDDDAYIDTFGNDDAVLLDNGDLYFVCSLRDGALTDIANVVLKINVHATAFPTFCFGDGTGTACPCGNVGAAGEGCANSTGAGAILGAAGSSSIAAANLVLSASQCPVNQPTLFFQGDNAVNSGAGT
ncbi:MAG: hypothetical protein H6828_15995, partial [Planctomycetes bacterium]|nr:hypothetical protein [Planctomycetota bacterium]